MFIKDGGEKMNDCDKLKELLSKLTKLKRLLFTNYEDESKQLDLKVKTNRLITDINIEYNRLRFVHKDLKDFDSHEIVGEVNVSKVKDMIEELKKYISLNCKD